LNSIGCISNLISFISRSPAQTPLMAVRTNNDMFATDALIERLTLEANDRDYSLFTKFDDFNSGRPQSSQSHKPTSSSQYSSRQSSAQSSSSKHMPSLVHIPDSYPSCLEPPTKKFSAWGGNDTNKTALAWDDACSAGKSIKGAHHTLKHSKSTPVMDFQKGGSTPKNSATCTLL